MNTPRRRPLLLGLVALACGGAGADKPDGVQLNLRVLGAGKPIAGAQVLIKAGKTEFKRVSDAGGKLRLTLQHQGKATIRVLAKGWQSYLHELELPAEAEQVLEIKLQPLSDEPDEPAGEQD